MHESVQAFIERMALMMEGEGLPRIAGRIFGFLLVHEGAFSLDELAEELQVSKASVSTNARLLVQYTMVERIGAPGDRRDYYQIDQEAWARKLRGAQRKWERMRQALNEAAESLPAEMKVGRRRLAEAAEFHLFMLDGVERVLDRWSKRHETRADVKS